MNKTLRLALILLLAGPGLLQSEKKEEFPCFKQFNLSFPAAVAEESRLPFFFNFDRPPEGWDAGSPVIASAPLTFTLHGFFSNRPGPSQKKARASRAIREALITYAIFSADYWNRYAKFVEDWQYTLTWEDQKTRFFTLAANRFDSNRFSTNCFHVLQAACLYNFPRVYHLPSFPSLLFALAGSLAWEYVTEWREVISINDNILSTFGGISLGECLFQAGKHFDSQRGIFNAVLTAAFNPVIAINNLLLPKDRHTAAAPASWHRFDLLFGLKNGSWSVPTPSYRQVRFGLDFQMKGIAGYDQPGKEQRWYSDTLDSSIVFDLSFDQAGIQEINASTTAVLAGLIKKNLTQNQNEGLKGYRWFLGIGSAFDFFQKKEKAAADPFSPQKSDYRRPAEQLIEFSDKLAAVHMIGPVYDLSAYFNRLSLHFRCEAFADFSLIHSLAFPSYARQHEISGVKTTLLNWGYYYGLGLTLNSSLGLCYRNLEAEGKLKYSHYSSIQGLDRFQDLVSDDFGLSDSRLIYGMAFSLRWPRTPLKLVLAWETIRRRGAIGDLEQAERETRFFYQLAYTF